ncbi:uncharacterized protein LOC129890690 [Solanum dulcamara]|uniref:uncharacterized protein LOC129890690 n=1 Tax=Solanum dulcamara TaxID=45834 RepID=UPI002485FC24|nr:uncharacterized protein LOC129890690 [Solanum dulcamara]
MELGLLGKNKLEFVDGRHTKDKFNVSLHDQWERMNAMVLSWIVNAVRKKLLSSIIYASNAHKVWFDLKERFDTVNGSKVFYLHREIVTLSQRTMLLQFLMGLNETYAQCRSQILMMSPIPTLSKAYSMVINHESQRSLASSSQVAEALEGATFFSHKRGPNSSFRGNNGKGASIISLNGSNFSSASLGWGELL